MIMETAPPRCENQWCRYPAYFAITEDGIEHEEHCSPVCEMLMSYVRAASHIEAGPAADRLAQMLVTSADLLNERGKDPRDPDPELAAKLLAILTAEL